MPDRDSACEQTQIGKQGLAEVYRRYFESLVSSNHVSLPDKKFVIHVLPRSVYALLVQSSDEIATCRRENGVSKRAKGMS